MTSGAILRRPSFARLFFAASAGTCSDVRQPNLSSRRKRSILPDWDAKSCKPRSERLVVVAVGRRQLSSHSILVSRSCPCPTRKVLARISITSVASRYEDMPSTNSDVTPPPISTLLQQSEIGNFSIITPSSIPLLFLHSYSI